MPYSKKLKKNDKSSRRNRKHSKKKTSKSKRKTSKSRRKQKLKSKKLSRGGSGNNNSKIRNNINVINNSSDSSVCDSNYVFSEDVEESVALRFFTDLFIKNDEKEAFKKHIIKTYNPKKCDIDIGIDIDIDFEKTEVEIDKEYLKIIILFALLIGGKDGSIPDQLQKCYKINGDIETKSLAIYKCLNCRYLSRFEEINDINYYYDGLENKPLDEFLNKDDLNKEEIEANIKLYNQLKETETFPLKYFTEDDIEIKKPNLMKMGKELLETIVTGKEDKLNLEKEELEKKIINKKELKQIARERTKYNKTYVMGDQVSNPKRTTKKDIKKEYTVKVSELETKLNNIIKNEETNSKTIEDTVNKLNIFKNKWVCEKCASYMIDNIWKKHAYLNKEDKIVNHGNPEELYDNYFKNIINDPESQEPEKVKIVFEGGTYIDYYTSKGYTKLRASYNKDAPPTSYKYKNNEDQTDKFKKQYEEYLEKLKSNDEKENNEFIYDQINFKKYCIKNGNVKKFKKYITDREIDEIKGNFYENIKKLIVLLKSDNKDGRVVSENTRYQIKSFEVTYNTLVENINPGNKNDINPENKNGINPENKNESNKNNAENRLNKYSKDLKTFYEVIIFKNIIDKDEREQSIFDKIQNVDCFKNMYNQYFLARGININYEGPFGNNNNNNNNNNNKIV